MPHATIEFSANLAEDVKRTNIVQMVHDLMCQCGLFSPADIKTRAFPAQDYRVGTKGVAGSFLHVMIAIKSGRTAEQKQKLSATLIEALQNALPHIDQASVDIVELSDAYRKYSGTKKEPDGL